jgi:hypothetical protein
MHVTTYYHKFKVRHYMVTNVRVLNTANSMEQRPYQEANSSIATRSEPETLKIQVRICTAVADLLGKTVWA